MISVRVQTAENGQILELSVADVGPSAGASSPAQDAPLEDLQAEIERLTSIRRREQKLIFQGRVLIGNALVADYGIVSESCVQVVRQGVPFESNSDAPPMAPPDEYLRRLHLPVASLFELGLSELVTNNFTSSAGARTPSTTTLDTKLPPVGSYFEPMRQTILSLETMLSEFKASPDSLKSFYPRTAGHTTRGPRYFLGQWVDCLDSIQQWLEATVIIVEPSRVMVHYNGWPKRWDEWIDSTSDRLAVFRSKTMHNCLSVYACPTMHCWMVDAPNTGDDEIDILIPAVESLHKTVMRLLSTHNLLESLPINPLVTSRPTIPPGVLSKELPVILDRFGRLCMDYSWELGFKMTNDGRRTRNPVFMMNEHHSTRLSHIFPAAAPAPLWRAGTPSASHEGGAGHSGRAPEPLPDMPTFPLPAVAEAHRSPVAPPFVPRPVDVSLHAPFNRSDYYPERDTGAHLSLVNSELSRQTDNAHLRTITSNAISIDHSSAPMVPSRSWEGPIASFSPSLAALFPVQGVTRLAPGSPHSGGRAGVAREVTTSFGAAALRSVRAPRESAPASLFGAIPYAGVAPLTGDVPPVPSPLELQIPRPAPVPPEVSVPRPASALSDAASPAEYSPHPFMTALAPPLLTFRERMEAENAIGLENFLNMAPRMMRDRILTPESAVEFLSRLSRAQGSIPDSNTLLALAQQDLDNHEARLAIARRPSPPPVIARVASPYSTNPAREYHPLGNMRSSRLAQPREETSGIVTPPSQAASSAPSSSSSAAAAAAASPATAVAASGRPEDPAPQSSGPGSQRRSRRARSGSGAAPAFVRYSEVDVTSAIAAASNPATARNPREVEVIIDRVVRLPSSQYASTAMLRAVRTYYSIASEETRASILEEAFDNPSLGRLGPDGNAIPRRTALFLRNLRRAANAGMLLPPTPVSGPPLPALAFPRRNLYPEERILIPVYQPGQYSSRLVWYTRAEYRRELVEYCQSCRIEPPPDSFAQGPLYPTMLTILPVAVPFAVIHSILEQYSYFSSVMSLRGRVAELRMSPPSSSSSSSSSSRLFLSSSSSPSEESPQATALRALLRGPAFGPGRFPTITAHHLLPVNSSAYALSETLSSDGLMNINLSLVPVRRAASRASGARNRAASPAENSRSPMPSPLLPTEAPNAVPPQRSPVAPRVAPSPDVAPDFIPVQPEGAAHAEEGALREQGNPEEEEEEEDAPEPTD